MKSKFPFFESVGSCCTPVAGSYLACSDILEDKPILPSEIRVPHILNLHLLVPDTAVVKFGSDLQYLEMTQTEIEFVFEAPDLFDLPDETVRFPSLDVPRARVVQNFGCRGVRVPDLDGVSDVSVTSPYLEVPARASCRSRSP